VAGVLVVARRRKSPPAVASLKHEGIISTGYTDLDGLLGGGIPERYGVVVVSPAYDERDFLLRKIIGTALSTSTPVFYLSSDTERTGDYLRSYGKDFYAFSPQADKIEHSGKNLYKIPGVENLSELNISFSLTSPMVEYQARKDVSKIIILDLLSDILLRHKALTTRKWLSDFIAKRKTEGFTTIASLNPLIAKEEAQTILDLFDGVIEIYERELRARPRRFLLVRKLYAKKYSENELLLDRDKLFST
jgi:KaiC/GvpD/RAD55 family RecA-like ATPase